MRFWKYKMGLVITGEKQFPTRNAWESLACSQLGIALNSNEINYWLMQCLTVPLRSKCRWTIPSTDQRLLYTVKSCNVQRYLAESHQIYTTYILIIAAATAPIGITIFHRISVCQHDEWRCVGQFSPNTGTPWALSSLELAYHTKVYQTFTWCSSIIPAVR